MKFSGHETFPVREGWLHKGLKLVSEAPELFLDEEACDHLGVGKNMAKSIRHWLRVLDLAEPSGETTTGNHVLLRKTEFGELVWEKDPFFLQAGTWWLLHVNLVNNRDSASSWHWFFNSFRHDRFDRAVCLESLGRYVEREQKRVPSAATLARDLGCMLLSYARSIPSTNDDPEDGADCPFRDLGLLSYYKTSGYYQLHQGVKDVPMEIFCYAMAKAFGETRGGADVRLHDVARTNGGPGRAFCLTEETLFELVSHLETQDKKIEIVGIAGDRAVRTKVLSEIEWIKRFYDRVGQECHVEQESYAS